MLEVFPQNQPSKRRTRNRPAYKPPARSHAQMPQEEEVAMTVRKNAEGIDAT